ncbi:MAG: HAMP domain-containing histidine kinase [Agathobacter sp.]|nr:HAMP domain-containing histidine kinase [Agathobacter sp.]
MPFINSKRTINIGSIVCAMLVASSIQLTANHFHPEIQLFGISTTTLALAFLIYWWQAQITKSYRRSIELRELESLRTEVAELNLKIQKLSEDNEKLARITHRDNTLITTLKNSTVKYLSTDFKNPAEAIAARDKLISNINALSAGRTSLPANYNERTPREFHTDISLMDELLHHMDETAIERKIEFAVHFGTELADFVPMDISESDLVHTVDDLLKNAFKATTTCEKRVVQLQFFKLGKHFVIEVADSGIPFEVESLVNMGIEKRTTYVDGSGIGLMDIWSTKNKYGATYHLEEYALATPFSKKISLTFDKKNRYSIRTWRKNEILALCRRADLQVYDHSE